MIDPFVFIFPSSLDNFVKAHAGGKASNLHKLSNAGFNIPTWCAIPASVFEDYISKNNLQDFLDEQINSTPYDENIIHNRFIEIGLPALLKSRIKETWEKYLKKEMISVRSSAADEDGSSHSFAGQLSSFLYITKLEDIYLSVLKCWASAFSNRGISYRQQNKLDVKNIRVSVIFQQMIDPETSGVLFTQDPLKPSSQSMMINAVFGVGEGLVGGHLDPDTWTFETNGKLLEANLVEKDKKWIRSSEGGCLEVDINPSVSTSCLTDGELKQLVELSTKIEDLYHFPQDVEWAIKDDKIYVLQSRPITTDVVSHKGRLFVWDNSNIVESYGGLTKPLTFGFARYVYHQVYVQFCEILYVPQKHIKEMDFFLKNMLGLFYGRVYYNLLNWYKLTSILPGYKFNRSFMETMMGTDEALADEIAARVRPPSFNDSFSSKIRKIITGMKFLWFHFSIQSVVDKFLSDFLKIWDEYRHIDYSKLPSDEIYEYYKKLEVDMLWKWHAPIINDFLCMIHFGVFKKLTDKWLSHLGSGFSNDLLAGNGNLESAEPTKRLITLAGEVTQNHELLSLVQNTDASDCLEFLRQSPHQDFYQKVMHYIDRYGFRCMSEMKLEQKDLHQDPSLFFVFLKNIINSGQTDLEQYEKREKEIRMNAEKLLTENISGLKKIFYSWSLKHARKAVRNRENTRFCRTRIYGVVRAMFYAIGKDYNLRGIIQQPDDIFYLSLEELKGSLEGFNTIQDLEKVIELRKKEYERYENMEPAPRFATRGPTYWNNKHFAPEVEIELGDLKENEMKGLGCCPGIIEGVVKVILSPEDDLTLNGEILVTHRTDPGWIPLYPSAKGLLVERGGLLSHSAIVAREMGLPTIVSIKGLTKRLKTGMKVRFNGETGLVEILEDV
ncbi:MAG: phosphoenolpyruvate synthase [Bdellovibrionales bacterium CG12_big_fil_rev_8_21_14_0_65_38_15]|nr:MAG: phosphoenolpyruvate synthase [Bdellovibrionales bacterium CG22_combo_CG10-13_8_21_14_all_38_13]PIQ54234.1 MAG: phosphoenolpyruvate synthase [Bdellovibrionales bacterium CG12_big_fil_rev_8_21_14_0_65_38_15]